MSEGNREMLLKTRGLTKQFGKHVAVDHVVRYMDLSAGMVQAKRRF